MGIDENERADQLARLWACHGISAKDAWGVIRGRTHEKYWQPFCGQRQDRGFLKISSATRAGELLNMSRNQLSIIMGLLTGHCHLKGHLFKVGLVDSPCVIYTNRHL
jgi:hypothetical protein